MKILKLITLSFFLGLNAEAHAFDFSLADSLFAKRGDGTDDEQRYLIAIAAYSQYKRAYEKGLLTPEESRYALTQAGRLSIYGGLLQIPIEKRREILSDCVGVMTKAIDVHYFKAACLAQLVKISAFETRIQYLLILKKEGNFISFNSDHGRDKETDDGGGVHRVFSEIFSDKQFEDGGVGRMGIFNPEKGLQSAIFALDTNSKVYPPFPDPMAGPDFYENFYFFSKALLWNGMEKNNLEKIRKAKDTLSSTIELIDDLKDADALPSGREPETLLYRRLMQELKESVRNCISVLDWQDCLRQELEWPQQEVHKGKKDSKADEL